MGRSHTTSTARHITRRTALQAGSLGLMGLSTANVSQMRALAAESGTPLPKPKAVIYLFLTGGPSQHDTFDMKPEGPAEYKGEFNPIATSTPGIQICEHFPLLAKRSDKWALVRSLTHKENGHDKGTYVMLTGNTVVPPTFRSSKPQPSDLPSIAAIAGFASQPRHNMPPSAILPERIYHSNTGVYPGQFAGMLGSKHEPCWLQCTDKPHAYHDYSGAFPKYLFNLHDGVASDKDDWTFAVPHLTLQEGMLDSRFRDRLSLLKSIDEQRTHLEKAAEVSRYDRVRQRVVSLITDPKVRGAFDVRNADAKTLERYGDNSFGWSLLMARRLIETGVNMVQVNMGKNSSWDTHRRNFANLKDNLLPPLDKGVAALMDDLHESGRLEDTLVMMLGGLGRTP
ncbi:MAG: DUF1501 domain-containing protein, partial [Fuerstiella sp.]